MQQINIDELKPISINRLKWILIKNIIAENQNIEMSELAQKIYNSSLPSFDILYQIHNYDDYVDFEKSNFHGGYNDRFMTKHEKIFNYMYPKLIYQKPFGTGKGGYKKYGSKRYIADFIDDEAKVIIEIDGKPHSNEITSLKDKIRNMFFLENGYLTIRFTNQDVINLYKIHCNKIAMEVENE